MWLARHVTLPIEDAVTFKDVLDRRVDHDFKCVFLMAGAASKPVLAWASVSKAVEIWANCLDDLLHSQEDVGQAEALLQNVKVAATFLVEAAINVIKLQARVMLTSVPDVLCDFALGLQIWPLSRHR